MDVVGPTKRRRDFGGVASITGTHTVRSRGSLFCADEMRPFKIVRRAHVAKTFTLVCAPQHALQDDIYRYGMVPADQPYHGVSIRVGHGSAVVNSRFCAATLFREKYRAMFRQKLQHTADDHFFG